MAYFRYPVIAFPCNFQYLQAVINKELWAPWGDSGLRASQGHSTVRCNLWFPTMMINSLLVQFIDTRRSPCLGHKAHEVKAFLCSVDHYILHHVIEFQPIFLNRKLTYFTKFTHPSKRNHINSSHKTFIDFLLEIKACKDRENNPLHLYSF